MNGPEAETAEEEAGETTEAQLPRHLKDSGVCLGQPLLRPPHPGGRRVGEGWTDHTSVMTSDEGNAYAPSRSAFFRTSGSLDSSRDGSGSVSLCFSGRFTIYE